MIRILSIGNSFSQDAQAYLHEIAAAGGREVKAVNLYIGGCSLKTHWENAEQDAKQYLYECNGASEERTVSIREALEEEAWDFVTLQQASAFSGCYDTYEPYLSDLSAYVSRHAPSAKQVIHETWAYERGFESAAYDELYQGSQEKMYAALHDAYQKAAALLGVPILPCGTVIQELRRTAPFEYQTGGRSLCRDGCHMDIPYGRYILGAVWYESLLHGDITANTWLPAESDPALIRFLQDKIHTLLN